jgi:hypothetical protein
MRIRGTASAGSKDRIRWAATACPRSNWTILAGTSAPATRLYPVSVAALASVPSSTGPQIDLPGGVGVETVSRRPPPGTSKRYINKRTYCNPAATTSAPAKCRRGHWRASASFAKGLLNALESTHSGEIKLRDSPAIIVRIFSRIPKSFDCNTANGSLSLLQHLGRIASETHL